MRYYILVFDIRSNLIPNLGEKRRRELLAHFGGMQGLLSASEREVAGVKGIGAVTARAVYAVLHE